MGGNFIEKYKMQGSFFRRPTKTSELLFRKMQQIYFRLVSICLLFSFIIGLNNIYSDKVHDIHKYNVKIVGSDSKPVAYLDHLLDML